MFKLFGELKTSEKFEFYTCNENGDGYHFFEKIGENFAVCLDNDEQVKFNYNDTVKSLI